MTDNHVLSPDEGSAMLPDQEDQQPKICLNCQQEKEKDHPVLENRRKKSHKGILAQSFVTAAVMLTSASCGMPIGYSAILLPQLQVQNDTMRIDEDMGSWIASIHSAATPLGSLLSGWLMDRFGRKLAVQISVLPLIAGWILIATAGNHAILLVGRLIAGVSVGLTAAPGQVLIGEVSEPYVRGIFSSVPFASYSFGILLVYALGSALEWRMVAGLSLILPCFAALVFFLLPESPVWLVRKGRPEEAKKSLSWLRGGDILQAERETSEIKARFEFEKKQGGQKFGSKNLEPKKNQNVWSQFLKPQILKPFLIINFFHLMQTLSGTYLVVFYAVDIISHLTDSIDSFLAAVLTAVIRFIFSIVSSILLALIGRRVLALTSGLGTAVFSISLGAYMTYCKFYEMDYSVLIPALCLIFYVAFNTVGFMILPGVLLGELYPSRVRGAAGGISFMFFNLTLFIAAKTFPFLKNSIGLEGIFYVFGFSSLGTCVFLYLILPETKGRTLSQIEDYFLEKNIFWITRDRNWERKNLT